MSEEVNQFAKTAIKQFGMSELSAKKFASTYMAMSNSLGAGGELGKNMALNLTGLVGDIASFYNITLEEANTAISAVYTGETESIKKLGIVLTEANLNAFAVSQGLKKTYNQMSQAEKVMLRYNYVMKASANIQGDFVRTGGNWANQVRILKEQWSQLLSILGKGLITVLKPVVVVLNEMLGSLIAVANALSRTFGGKGIESASGSVSSTFGDMADGAGDVSTGLDDANSSAKALAKTVAGFDEINTLVSQPSGGGGTGVGGDITGSGEITDTPEAESNIAKMSAYMKELQDILAKWKDRILKLEFNFDKEKAVEDLKGIGKNLLDIIAGWGTFVINVGVQLANDLDIGQLANDLMGFFNSLTGFVAVLTDVVGPAIGEFYRTSGLQDIVKWIGDKLSESLQSSSSKLDEWADWLKNNQENIKDFGTKLGAVVTPLSNIVLELLKISWDMLASALSTIADAVEKIANNIINMDEGQLSFIRNLALGFGALKVIGTVLTPLISFVAGLELATIKAGEGISTFQALKKALDLKLGMVLTKTGGEWTLTEWLSSLIKRADEVVMIVPRALQKAFGAIGGYFNTFLDPELLIGTTYKTKIANIITNIGSTIGNGLKGALISIVPNLQATFLQIGAVFQNLGAMVAEKGVFGTAMAGLKGILGGVGGAFKALWAVAKAHPFVAVVSVIVSVITSVVALYQRSEEFRDLLKDIYENTIKPVFAGVKDTFTDLYKNHLKPLIDKIFKGEGSLVGQIKPIIKKIWDFLTTFIGWVSANILPVFITVFGSILQTIGEVASDIIDLISGLIDIFTGLLKFISGVFSGDWKKAWEGIKQIFKGVFDSLVAIAKAPLNLIIGLINGVLNGLTAGMNGVIRLLNRLSFKVPDWVPGLGGEEWGFNLKTFSAPKIPYLANGGVITQPTMAMMGEYAGAYNNPEIVTPQALLQEIIYASNSNIVDALIQQTRQLLVGLEQMNMEVCIGDDVIAQSAQRGNQAYKRRTGRPLFV